MYAQAEAFEAHGQLLEAAEAYSSLLGAGDDAQTHLRLGLVQRQLGELAAAARSFEAAAAASPQTPYPLMRRGQLALDLGQVVQAADWMAQAVEVSAGDGGMRWREMQVNLVAVLTRLMWLDSACRLARTLPPGLPDWWAGAREKALVEFKDARRFALDALVRRRGAALSGDEWLDLARRLLALGRLRSARAIAEGLLARYPEWHVLTYFLADVVARQAGPAAALARLRAAGDVPRNSPEFMGSEIRFLQECGRWDEVLQRLEGTPGTPRFPHVRAAGVTAMLMLGRTDSLAGYCAEWMAEEPDVLAPAATIVFLGSRRPAPPAPPAPQPVNVMQFWHSPQPPEDVLASMASWVEHNPGWTQTLFDAESARDFFRTYFDHDAIRALDLCFHPAMMADVFRLGYLATVGGVYADADEVCLRPVSQHFPHLGEAELLAPLAGSFPGYVHNFFIGAQAGGVIMADVLAGAVAAILSAERRGERPDIWQTTGPGALTRGVARHLARGGAGGPPVILLPEQQYRAHVQTEGSLAYKRDQSANWRIAELR